MPILAMMSVCAKVLPTAKGANVDLEIEPWRPTVFIGMNSTLKSYTARTFVGAKPNLYDTAEVSISPENIVCGNSSNAECLYLEDYRLALRKLLSSTSDIKQLIEYLHILKDSIRARLDAEHVANLVEGIEVRMKHFMDKALFGIVDNYCRLKHLANLSFLPTSTSI